MDRIRNTKHIIKDFTGLLLMDKNICTKILVEEEGIMFKLYKIFIKSKNHKTLILKKCSKLKKAFIGKMLRKYNTTKQSHGNKLNPCLYFPNSN